MRPSSPTMLRRALLAFLALPGLVAFAVPLTIAWPVIRAGQFNPIAVIPLACGIALLAWCVREFLVSGQGTLAPWDPPRRLVSSGPYRRSRNPMYLAVTAILFGWAIAFSSWGLLGYALAVAIVFHLRVVFGEEPRLDRTYHRHWKDYARRVPRWIFPTRRAVVVSVLGGVVLLLLAGIGYEVYADGRAARDFPAPGQMVDVGGRRLHLLCIGSGAPVVMFEASGWGTSLSSSMAREQISGRTTVCSYDRRGRGWSDVASGPTTMGALANDLGVLQDRARLPSPMVIVATSIGGMTAELFARNYPERVGGLVFLDAASSVLLPRVAGRETTINMLACTAGAAAQFGLIRLLDPFSLGDESEGARRAAALSYGARPWAEVCATVRGLEATKREFEKAPPLRGDVPLIALSAATTEQLMPPFAHRFVDPEQIRAELEETHRQLAGRSTRGRWAKVPGSGHLIGDSKPDAVVDAVFEVLEQVRGSGLSAPK